MTDRLVVDASIAFKWLHSEEDSEAAQSLGQHYQLHAPELIRIECANALWSAARRGNVSAEAALTALLELEEGFHTLHSDAELPAAAFRLGLEISHPIYDCCYLALALKLDCSLVTADLRFIRALVTSHHAGRVKTLAELAP